MRYVIAALVLLSIAAAFVIGCRKDIIVEPPPSLSGDYVGTYTYRSGSINIVKPIVWKFTLDQFLMDVDLTKLADGEDRVFCDVSGLYAQSTGVELRARYESDWNRKKQKCIEPYGPFGQYALDQSKDGVVQMKSETTVGDVTTTRILYLEVVK